MRVIFITQNDNFYVPLFFNNFLNKSSEISSFEISYAYILPASPNNKKNGIIQKGLNYLFLFGPIFFIYYFFLYSYKKLFCLPLNSIFNKYNIKNQNYFESINSKKFLKEIKKKSPDLIISIACNQVFKKDLLKIPTIGCLNLHSSLLPKDRGLMPSFWALCKNYKYSGVSVFFMDEYLDNGPIIVQKKITLKGLSLHSLMQKSKVIGAECMLEALKKISNKKYHLKENLFSKSTYNKFPTNSDVKLFKKNNKKFF